jgi:hypothetical protein
VFPGSLLPRLSSSPALFFPGSLLPRLCCPPALLSTSLNPLSFLLLCFFTLLSHSLSLTLHPPTPPALTYRSLSHSNVPPPLLFSQSVHLPRGRRMNEGSPDLSVSQL